MAHDNAPVRAGHGGHRPTRIVPEANGWGATAAHRFHQLGASVRYAAATAFT